MTKQKTNILWTVVGSFCFLALPLIISVRPPGEPLFLFSLPMVRDMITNAFILLFFFLNYYLFIPRLFFRKEYWVYGACIAFGFLCICLIPSSLTGHIPWQPSHTPPFHPPFQGAEDHGPGGPGDSAFQLPPPPGPTAQGPVDRGPSDLQPRPFTPSYSFLQEISHSIYLYITVILFSNLLRTRGRLFELQKEKVDAELSSLKSQINPHFLFNTLNSIYALAVRKDDKTADAIINLAGLMRYMIKEAHGDRIPLHKELDYLTNYVELQKARLRDTAAVSLTIHGEVGTLEIAPLILITFVENAFKYGINPEMDSQIRIGIDIRDGTLTLTVFNTKVLISSLDLSTGIGLDNTRNRLERLYGNEHRLDIKEDKETYTIFLSIHLI